MGKTGHYVLDVHILKSQFINHIFMLNYFPKTNYLQKKTTENSSGLFMWVKVSKSGCSKLQKK